MTTSTFNQLANHLDAATKEAVALRTALAPLAAMYPIASSHDDASASLDQATFNAAPVAVVPLHGMFVPLIENKHRFLLANDGLYIEVRRPWLHLIQKIADQQNVSMPFGEITPRTDFAFGRLGVAIDYFREFAIEAIVALPNEHAKMIAWDDAQQQLIPIKVDIENASPSSLTYRCPALPDHQSLVIDLHSHGNISAFFSETDNADDAGAVKFSGVFGNLDQDAPTVEFRLCVLGLYLPIKVPADKIFKDL
jgi:PRTRC genetic system protein A